MAASSSHVLLSSTSSSSGVAGCSLVSGLVVSPWHSSSSASSSANCSSGQFCWLSPPCTGTIESMDADFRMTGEEMDGEEEELETGFGRDLIIRRMIGELPTLGLPSRSGLFLPELLGLARLPRGEERPGGGRPEAGSPPFPPLWVEPGLIPPAEREGDDARSCARDVDIDGRAELKSCCWLGGLGLNFLGGGWGEGCSVQWVGSKLVAASCHCWRLPFVNVSSDLVEAGLLSLLIVLW